MNVLRATGFNRRGFLEAVSAAATCGLASAVKANDWPVVKNPRAIANDTAVEPKWDSAIEVTVGPQKADLVGSDEKTIQAAVDYVTRWGGGTVRILPGTYRLRNAVFLQSRVRLVGSGLDSVLIKEPSVRTKLAENADFYEQEITLADPNGFRVGDGICLRARSQRNNGIDIFTRTLVARSGNRFKLDRPLPGYPGMTDLWLAGDASAATLYALINGEDVSDVVIENITLDGNKANNEFLNGNHVGCIYLQHSNRVAIRGVTARNFNGDGIAWGTSHDVVVESCHSHDHAGLALHPGSGAQRPVARGNRLERNDIGFYFCWGVKYGLVENNVILDNKRHGVSAGHGDTDNLIRRNEIRRSGLSGILIFRDDSDSSAAPPHRNRLEENLIFDSGGEEGVGVDVQGATNNTGIARNAIRETRQPMKRIGVRLGAEVGRVSLEDNRIEGFAVKISDLRKNA